MVKRHSEYAFHVLFLILKNFCDEWLLSTSELTNDHCKTIWRVQLFKWHASVCSSLLNIKHIKPLTINEVKLASCIYR